MRRKRTLDMRKNQGANAGLNSSHAVAMTYQTQFSPTSGCVNSSVERSEMGNYITKETYRAIQKEQRSSTQRIQRHQQAGNSRKNRQKMKSIINQSLLETVPIESELIVPQQVDSRGLTNPYQFKFSDKFMQKETAPNYYPPIMRKLMKEYMSKTSIKFETSCDAGTHIGSSSGIGTTSYFDQANSVNWNLNLPTPSAAQSQGVGDNRSRNSLSRDNYKQMRQNDFRLKKINQVFDNHFSQSGTPGIDAGSQGNNIQQSNNMIEQCSGQINEKESQPKLVYQPTNNVKAMNDLIAERRQNISRMNNKQQSQDTLSNQRNGSMKSFCNNTVSVTDLKKSTDKIKLCLKQTSQRRSNNSQNVWNKDKGNTSAVFGDKSYKNVNFQSVNVGAPNTLPSAHIQPMTQRALGAHGPEKQFMKIVNYKASDKSISQTSYGMIDTKEINKQLAEQRQISLNLKNELKQRNFDMGFENKTDYRTIKKLMQDNGFVGFKRIDPLEKKERRRKMTESKIFEQSKLKASNGLKCAKSQYQQQYSNMYTQFEIYKGDNDPKNQRDKDQQKLKKIVKKTTPREPFVMKRSGSQLSIIEEKCKKDRVSTQERLQNLQMNQYLAQQMLGPSTLFPSATSSNVGFPGNNNNIQGLLASNIYSLNKGQSIKSANLQNADIEFLRKLKVMTSPSGQLQTDAIEKNNRGEKRKKSITGQLGALDLKPTIQTPRTIYQHHFGMQGAHDVTTNPIKKAMLSETCKNNIKQNDISQDVAISKLVERGYVNFVPSTRTSTEKVLDQTQSKKVLNPLEPLHKIIISKGQIISEKDKIKELKSQLSQSNLRIAHTKSNSMVRTGSQNDNALMASQVTSPSPITQYDQVRIQNQIYSPQGPQSYINLNKINMGNSQNKFLKNVAKLQGGNGHNKYKYHHSTKVRKARRDYKMNQVKSPQQRQSELDSKLGLVNTSSVMRNNSQLSRASNAHRYSQAAKDNNEIKQFAKQFKVESQKGNMYFEQNHLNHNRGVKISNQLQDEKEKQMQLILQNQTPEAIDEQINGHKAINRNYKKFLNLTHRGLSANQNDSRFQTHNDGEYVQKAEKYLSRGQRIEIFNQAYEIGSQIKNYHNQNHYKLGYHNTLSSRHVSRDCNTLSPNRQNFNTSVYSNYSQLGRSQSQQSHVQNVVHVKPPGGVTHRKEDGATIKHNQITPQFTIKQKFQSGQKGIDMAVVGSAVAPKIDNPDRNSIVEQNLKPNQSHQSLISRPVDKVSVFLGADSNNFETNPIGSINTSNVKKIAEEKMSKIMIQSRSQQNFNLLNLIKTPQEGAQANNMPPRPNYQYNGIPYNHRDPRSITSSRVQTNHGPRNHSSMMGPLDLNPRGDSSQNYTPFTSQLNRSQSQQRYMNLRSGFSQPRPVIEMTGSRIKQLHRQSNVHFAASARKNDREKSHSQCSFQQSQYQWVVPKYAVQAIQAPPAGK